MLCFKINCLLSVKTIICFSFFFYILTWGKVWRGGTFPWYPFSNLGFNKQHAFNSFHLETVWSFRIKQLLMYEKLHWDNDWVYILRIYYLFVYLVKYLFITQHTRVKVSYNCSMLYSCTNYYKTNHTSYITQPFSNPHNPYELRKCYLLTHPPCISAFITPLPLLTHTQITLCR